MPVVPFNRPIPQAKVPNPQPQVNDTYLAIAAAGMHEQNRLFEKPSMEDIRQERNKAVGRIVAPPSSGFSRKNGDAMDFNPDKWLAPSRYRLEEDI